MAWKRVDLPTLARPTYKRQEVSNGVDGHSQGRIIRTIPLFKLLPGRPRSTFFSSSFFLGGILRRCLAAEVVKFRVVELVEVLMERTKAGQRWSSNAGPAAWGKSVEWLEMKRDNRWSWLFVLNFWGREQRPLSFKRSSHLCICQRIVRCRIRNVGGSRAGYRWRRETRFRVHLPLLAPVIPHTSIP